MEPKRGRIRDDQSGKKHNRPYFTTVTWTPQGKYALKCFVRSAKAGEIPDQWVTDHLVESFEKILAGIPAAKALGLQAGQGNKNTRAQQLRDQKIAAETEYLYAQRGRGPRNNVLSEVADRYHRSESQIKKIYLADQRKRRRIARTMSKGTKK